MFKERFNILYEKFVDEEENNDPSMLNEQENNIHAIQVTSRVPSNQTMYSIDSHIPNAQTCNPQQLELSKLNLDELEKNDAERTPVAPGYMSVETLSTTGSDSVTTKTKEKYVLCGIFSMVEETAADGPEEECNPESEQKIQQIVINEGDFTSVLTIDPKDELQERLAAQKKLIREMLEVANDPSQRRRLNYSGEALFSPSTISDDSSFKLHFSGEAFSSPNMMSDDSSLLSVQTETTSNTLIMQYFML